MNDLFRNAIRVARGDCVVVKGGKTATRHLHPTTKRNASHCKRQPSRSQSPFFVKYIHRLHARKLKIESDIDHLFPSIQTVYYAMMIDDTNANEYAFQLIRIPIKTRIMIHYKRGYSPIDRNFTTRTSRTIYFVHTRRRRSSMIKDWYFTGTRRCRNDNVW